MLIYPINPYEKNIIYSPIRNPDNGEYERKKNTDIEMAVQQINHSKFSNIQKIRMGWAYVWRAEQNLIDKVVANNPSGKRPRGRPRQRWTGRIKNDLKRTHQTVVMDEEADNRDRWRVLV